MLEPVAVLLNIFNSYALHHLFMLLFLPQMTVGRSEWLSILTEFGSFPGDERPAIWCGLLRLPRCKSIFSALQKKQIHSAVLEYENL